MQFSQDRIKKIAKLARIMLSEKEEKALEKDLSEILDYFSILKKAKTDKIEPTSQVTGLLNIRRPDEVNYNFSREDMLASAPKKEKNLIKVKKIFD